MSKNYKVTIERLEELKAELEYLKTVREKEVAEQIKEARSFGDLSENSEYDEAKNEQGKLYSKIAEIENIISNAVVIEEQTATDQIRVGSHIKVLDLEDNSEEEYYIVGSQEANPREGRISDESPFGVALIGAKKGQTIKFEAPLGKMKYKVLDIYK